MHPVEYKVICLRECPVKSRLCDNPKDAVAFWRQHVQKHPQFNPEVECAVCVALNTRLKVKGFYIISVGTADCCHVHAREVFRAAIVASATAVILIHNHPSGCPTPSQADVDTASQLIHAGQLLGIPLLDSIIIGRRSHYSIKAHRPGLFGEVDL